MIFTKKPVDKMYQEHMDVHDALVWIKMASAENKEMKT